MKTTLVLKDDLFRRAKAQAAMQGKTLSRFMEESLAAALRKGDTSRDGTLDSWAKALPRVPNEGLKEIQDIIHAQDFRQIDESMWR